MTATTRTNVVIALVALAGLLFAVFRPWGFGRQSLAWASLLVAICAIVVVRRLRHSRWGRLSDDGFLESPLVERSASAAIVAEVRGLFARALDQPADTILPGATVSELLARDSWFGTEGMSADHLREELQELWEIDIVDGKIRIADIVNEVARKNGPDGEEQQTKPNVP